MVFICETKKAKGFMGTVCRKLNFGERWTVRDPVGKKGGMLVAWRENVQVQVISSTKFCMEL